MLRLSAVALMALMVAGCTTVPQRFTQNPQLSQKGGYLIEAEDVAGFQLELFYKSFSFFPKPDDSIQDARNFFVRIAQDVARNRGRAVKPILFSALQTNSTRNIIDGFYAVYISGRVEYAL